MASYAFVAILVSAGFLFVAGRWLLALRGAALDRKIPLTWVDRLVAGAPIGYTVFAFVAAGALFDRADAALGSGAAHIVLPIVGALDRQAAVFLLLLLGALGIASPLVLISVVEHHFARKIPEIVKLGRRAAFATLTGVRMEDLSESLGPAPPTDEEEEWRRLLRRSRRG
jgi:hypothetical protein